MKILNYLLKNYDVDGDNDLDKIWAEIDKQFGRDDFVELANILVLVDNLPKDLCQKFWDHM